MHVYIPTPDLVATSVLESISRQTLPCAVHTVICAFDESIGKRERIVMTRKKCQGIALGVDAEFVIFNDSDIEHLYDDNFEKMLSFMTDNDDYGAVALLRRKYVKGIHICSGCFMARKSFLLDIDFSTVSPPLPTCHSIMSSAVKCGVKYDYLDKTIRVKHITR
jgi:hypothetical protein